MATMTTPTKPRPDIPEVKWTPRQKQVLDLLVKRYTNGQIGEALGISLDGAKWHVSEIISILGVDSREEAADYWREYNGLPARVRRVAAGLFAGGAALRWAAAAGIAALAVVAGIAALVTLQALGSEETPSATATATSVPGGAVTPAPSPPATPPPGGGGGIPITVGGGAAMPANLILYYHESGYGTEGNVNSLIRTYRGSNGELLRDDLFGPLQQYGGVYSWRADFPRGVIVAAVCTRGYCGGMPAATPDSENRVFRSLDGGISWSEYGPPLPLDSFISYVGHNEVLAVTYTPPADPRDNWTADIWRYPSGDPASSPAGVPEPASPWSVPGLGPVWRGQDGRWLKADGTLVANGFVAQTDAALPSRPVLGLPDGRIVFWWSGSKGKPYSEEPWENYFSVVNPDGSVERSFSYPATQSLDVDALVGPSLALGNVSIEGGGRSQLGTDIEVALFDLETGMVSPLPEIGAPLQGPNLHPYVNGAVTGTFLRVANTGDCLNVRAEPDTGAQALTCYRDGVLLCDRGETREAGGITWRAVTTPDGRDGWASGEFLE